MRRSHTSALLMAASLIPTLCGGQSTIKFPSTAVSPTGSYAVPSSNGGGIDTINLGNLNAYFTIPIVQKAGRGDSFSYSLAFNSTVWHTAYVAGVNTWQPDSHYGWDFSTPTYRYYNGYVASQIVQSWTQPCDPQHNNWTPVYVEVYSFFVFHDAAGATHPFNLTTSNYTLGSSCPAVSAPPTTGTSLAVDGSGYKLSASQSGGGITGLDGKVLDLSGALSSETTDANGNQVTQFTQNSQVFTDTMGQTVLTIAGTNPVTLTYPGPNGSSPQYAIHYSLFNVNTYFNCSNIAEYTASNVSLVTSIDAPDGRSYQFSYEPTPNNSGYTTARLARITLPTGATISYQYTGANDGVVCTDGTTLGLTRTISGNTWQYVRNNVSGNQWTTTVTSPPDPANAGSASNVTVINFSKDTNSSISAPNFYETQRQVYQGVNSPSNLLLTTLNCYNGNYANCATADVTTPITQVDSYATWPGTTAKTSLSETIYDTSGRLSKTREYDFGVALGAAPSAGLLKRETVITYANLVARADKPATVTVKDGSGGVKALTTYSYDQTTPTPTSSPQHVTPASGSRGNVTTMASQVSAGTTLYKVFTYYDTGMLRSATDWGTTSSGGANITTYNYADATSTCGNTFPTSVTLPLLGTIPVGTYDCVGGVETQTKDLNGNATAISYNDPNFWRPTSILYPDGGQDSFGYAINPVKITTTSRINASSNLVSATTYDNLGRPAIAQITSDPPGIEVDTSYDALGRVASITNPYRSINDPTYGGTQYTYDALKRVTKVTNPDSSTVQTSFTQASVQVQDEVGRKRISQSDGLGRLISVCEVTNATQMGTGGTPTACGQDIAGTGFITSYGYDVLGNLTGVTQAGQTRSYVYDQISRLTSERNPETGTTAAIYAYDSCKPGELCSVTRPKPNQTGSTTVTTSYTYDALHRVTGRSYNDGSTPAVTFSYDLGSIWGASLLNSKGRLSSFSINQTSYGAFSYDSMGRVKDNWQWTPLNWNADASGAFLLTYGYDMLGNRTSMYNRKEGLTYTYSFDAAARLSTMQSSLVDSSHPGTLFTVNQYNPLSEVQQATFGNGISRTMGYDNRGRLTSLTDGSIHNFTLDYTSASDILTGNDSINGNWSYTYDDFGRVATSSKAGQSFNYQYDRFGNRWQQNAPQGGPAPQYVFDLTKNRISGSGISYDAAGNITNDGVGHTYTYDAENRVVSVAGSSNATYVYDGFGQRVRATVSGVTSDYIFDDQAHVVTTVNGVAVARTELYADGMHLGTYANNTTYFDHSDWLGTVRARSYPNGSGAVTCTNAAFGDDSSCIGADASPVHFTGIEHDSESNLDHMLFRQYSSTQGRWTTPDPGGLGAVDPTNPQSWNRYAYVSNNPLALLDPWGLIPPCTTDKNDSILCLGITLKSISSACPWGYIYIQGTCMTLGAVAAVNSNCTLIQLYRGFVGGVACNASPVLARPVAAGSGFTLGLRVSGQSFNDCMKANAGNYSLLGVADFALDANGKIADNFWLGFTPASNTVTNVYNGITGSLTSLLQTGPMTVQAGMGTTLTYGRRTSSIMNLNLRGTPGGPKGGFPALGSARSNAARAAKAAGGLLKLAIDTGFSLAEAVGCSINR